MFALVAAIVFGVAALGGHVAHVSLTAAGLFFLALHHVVGEWSPWRH